MALEQWLFTRRIPAPMFNGLVRGRRGLRAMRARLGPVNGEVIDRTLAIAEIRAVGLAAELDLAEHVARRGLTSQELADVAEVDSDALDRLLHLLASTGWFQKRRDGTWTNTRLSKSLRVGHPLSMRDWARFFGGGDLFRIFAGADVSLRTGDSATTAVMGRPFFEWTAHDREAGARFDGAMRDASRFLGESLAATVPMPHGATICDVGGGTGRLVAALLARHPDRRGILFDLPDVIAGASAVLAPAGVADRVETVAGSFFDGVPAGADRYVLVSVVHDWDDERAAEILTRCRDAVAGDARILVVEQVLDESAPALFARHSDVLMLVLTGAGRERTMAQFESVFTRAGLKVATQWRLPTQHAVFELAPATGSGGRGPASTARATRA
jgi:hypothetical protein